MKCNHCERSIEDEDAYYAVHPVGLPTRYFHDECYSIVRDRHQRITHFDMDHSADYWPPKAAFPTDEELQREEMKGDR